MAKDDQASRLMSVPQDCILQLAESQKEVYLNSNEGLFQKIFPAEATFRSVIFVPNKLSNGCRILIEAVYQDFYVYSEEDILLLRWASREIGILVEKTKLMGNSVLLQESHHRIKNNLQIIVSLLEMERVKLDTRGIARNDIPVVNEILDNISQRVQSMAHIHNILCKDNAANSVIDLYSIVREIASIYESSASMQLEFEEILVPYGMAVSFALVANELFNNSVKHNQGLAYNLQIHVSATLDDARGNYRIVFQDNGRGFPSILPKESDGGIGNVIIDSIIQMELCGTYQQKNQNGARVEIEIPASFILEDIKK